MIRVFVAHLAGIGPKPAWLRGIVAISESARTDEGDSAWVAASATARSAWCASSCSSCAGGY